MSESKDSSEWEEDDLVNLITIGAEENFSREFKRADALGIPGNPKLDEERKTEISKDVSAFANSAGGVIIYGIAEDENEPHPAIAISPVDSTKFSKEWLEQVINSRIRPHISGLLIHPISLSKSHPGKIVYLVKVPQSFTAHQAYDKRYYRRFNFQSVAMEDYEVRSAMNRRRRPMILG